jgi:hypothetical protein
VDFPVFEHASEEPALSLHRSPTRRQWTGKSWDGEPVRPPGAPAYAPDGFGGKNAVLAVPGKSE